MVDAGPLDQTDDDLIAVLGLLERLHRHVLGAEREKGEAPTKDARLTAGLHADQRLVEARRLGHHAAFAPVAGMTHDGAGKFMVAEVQALHLGPPHEGLARQVSGRDIPLGGVQQTQAQGAGVRLVPAILAVAEQGHPKAAVGVGLVDPGLRRDLVGFAGIHAAHGDAHARIVGGLRGRRGQREGELGQGAVRAPVDGVVDAHHVAAGRQRDALHKARAVARALDLQGDAHWALLADGDHPGARPVVKGMIDAQDMQGRTRWTGEVLVTHFPSRPGIDVVVEQLHLEVAAEQLAAQDLVVDAGDVALGSQAHTVALILEPLGADSQAGVDGVGLVRRGHGKDRKFQRTQPRHKGQDQDVAATLQDLHRHLVASGVVDAHRSRCAAREVHRHLDHVLARLSQGIGHHHRLTLHPGIQAGGHSADAATQDLGELVLRHHLIVP